MAALVDAPRVRTDC